MSSQDSTSNPPRVRPGKHPMGTETKLLEVTGGPAVLFMLCGDRFGASQAFRSGRFALQFIRISKSLVSMATCSVEDHHWMLARDSLTLRAGHRTFVFALPGFLYGLRLPAGCSEHECNLFEGILMRFCAYRDLRGEEDSGESGNIWASVHSKIIKLATQSTKIKSELSRAEIPGSGKKHTVDLPDTIRMKVLRAVRMSAALKLVSGALLTGSLDSARHLTTAANYGREDDGGQCFLPTMSTIAGLLLAIESGSVCGPLQTLAPVVLDGYWCLNKEGLAFLTKAALATCNARQPDKRRRLETIEEDGDESGVEMVSGRPCCGSSRGGGGAGRVKEVKREHAVH